jgi:capsid protein
VRLDQDLDPGYVRQHYACMLVNYGGLREMAGDVAGAATIYRRAAEWAPEYRPALAALASLRQSAKAQARRQAQAPDAAAG